jgi:uncharacterized membrane protein YecN with MAPEG domain
VSQQRIDSKTFIGEKSTDASSDESKNASPLLVALRSHGNFCENVPMAILMGAIVEMNGGNRRVLTAGFAALLLARIAHVELGLKAENNMGLGRLTGHATSMAFVASMAGYAAWLVRGYWGF